MGNPAVFARNLQRLVERSARTRRELAPDDRAYKRLSRWLTVGLERPNNALYELCRQIGVWDIDALWDEQAEEKEKADADWGAGVRRLIQIHREHQTNYEINGLLTQLAEAYHATEAADRLSKERPDLGDFYKMYRTAAQWRGLKSDEEVYTRLLSHLTDRQELSQIIRQEVEQQVGEFLEGFVNHVKSAFQRIQAKFDQLEAELKDRQPPSADEGTFVPWLQASRPNLWMGLVEAKGESAAVDLVQEVHWQAKSSEEAVAKLEAELAEWKQAQTCMEIVEKLAEHPNWTDYVERRFGGDDDAAERSILEEWSQVEGSVTLEDFCGDYISRWLDS